MSFWLFVVHVAMSLYLLLEASWITHCARPAVGGRHFLYLSCPNLITWQEIGADQLIFRWLVLGEIYRKRRFSYFSWACCNLQKHEAGVWTQASLEVFWATLQWWLVTSKLRVARGNEISVVRFNTRFCCLTHMKKHYGGILLWKEQLRQFECSLFFFP